MERLRFRITQDTMRAFRQLSGDDNPLHEDASYAERRGFTGPVVYGGLIVAQVSRLLGTRFPGPGCVWRSLDFRFRSPLYVGEEAEVSAEIIHANPELGLANLRIRVTAGARCIAEGEAAAMVARELSREHAHV